MFNFNFYMRYHLVKMGCIDILETPFFAIESNIRNYLLERLEIKDNNEDIYTLFSLYTLKVENMNDLAIIIHYLLGYISLLQSFEVIWHITEIDEPAFTYNNYYLDKIDALNTSNFPDYNKVFALVFNMACELKKDKEEKYTR